MTDDLAGKRVFIYARVSTTKQERNDISVPDQVDTLTRWIEDRGGTLVQVFTEAGSATDDERRKFQEMIALAESPERPVDLIVAHSLSRLFRNALQFMQYRERLKRKKVRVISITQNFGDDPASDLALSMMAVFDEYHSAENAKHVSRTMIANAANGYWNGQSPPIGFRTYVVPQPRGKDRKKLEHDPMTVDLVRYIFKTYLQGTADGPIGITRLAEHLTERGERLKGKPFSVQNLHHILTNTAYIGYVLYNKHDSRTGETRPETAWVPIPVPPIVSEEDFYAVRKQMADRDPRMGKEAEKTNDNLLTKRLICGCDGDGCGGGMKTATGGSGRHRYYACANRVDKGPSVCPGRRLPMGQFDGIVIDAVTEHLLQPERLNALLQTWLDRSETAIAARTADLKRLRTRLTQLDGESANVIKLVRGGICSADDPQIAAELANVRAQRISVEADLVVVERQLQAGDRRITPAIIDQFGELLTRKLKGSETNLRRDYIRLLVDRVEVGDRQIRITGSKTALARAAVASQRDHGPVPKAERKWCTQSDSNARPSDS